MIIPRSPDIPRKIANNTVEGVQYLRGICATLVVISHENGFLAFPEYFGAMPLPGLEQAAVFAVAVFFSISGFIIVIATADLDGCGHVTRRRFAMRRFVRILPFLWACTLGYNLLSWAGTGQLDWASALRTLVVWPLGDLKPNVAWSLRHELLFYVLFGLTMLGAARWRWLMAAWLMAPIATYLLTFDLGLVAVRPGEAGYELFKVVLMGGDHGANLQFGIGMLFGYAFLRYPERLGGQWAAVWMLLLMIMASAVLVIAPQPPGMVRVLVWSFFAAAILWAAVTSRPLQGWLGALARQLGDSSFSIYLVHNTVMLILLAVAGKLGIVPHGWWALMAFLVIAVVLSVLVSIGVSLWIERPLIALTRRVMGMGGRARPTGLPPG